MIHFLAISGSLRESSSNRRLLEALALVAGDHARVTFYMGLADLPHFNPDLDIEPAPEAVDQWRQQLAAADAVVLSTPEYAHGVPGSLKNALDWVVGSGELVNKPVALLNASARARHAYESLAETLRTMSAEIVEAASITVPLAGEKLDAAGIARHAEFSPLLRRAVEALRARVGRVA